MRTHRFLRRKAASHYLEEAWGVTRTPSTLAKYAVIGGGPIFRRAGRVPLYLTDDLDEWVASKLSAPMRSTSDTASPKGKSTGSPPRTNSGEHQDGDIRVGEKRSDDSHTATPSLTANKPVDGWDHSELRRARASGISK
jgi:hypothetical protein